jgi:hypothetical protein
VIIAVWPWGAYLGEEALEHGVRVMTSSWRRIGPNTLPAAAKASGQYLNSQLAKMEAMHAGYDEAILLNEQGFLADGSGENVFVVPGRRTLDAAGRRRRACPASRATRSSGSRAGWATRSARPDVVRSNLYHADEVFFTGTAAEITPIRSVDDHEIGPARSRSASRPEFFAITTGPLGAVARIPRLPSATARQGVSVEATRQVPPLSRPDIGPLEEEYVLAALRSGVLGLGPLRAQLREGVRRRSATASTPSPSRAARPACTLLVRAAGIGEGDEVRDRADLVRALGQRDALRARDAGLRRGRSRHVRARPGGRRGSDHRRARAASCPSTCSATRATCRRLGAIADKHGS